MDYYLEITKKFEEYCDTKPYPDKRIQYAENAATILNLYLDAMVIAEDTEDDKALEKIYDEMCSIIG